MYFGSDDGCVYAPECPSGALFVTVNAVFVHEMTLIPQVRR
jgi:hypothetical protein